MDSVSKVAVTGYRDNGFDKLLFHVTLLFRCTLSKHGVQRRHWNKQNAATQCIAWAISA